MRRFMLVIGLLSVMALPSWADEKQPAKAPAAYFKVEIRGTLQVGGAGNGDWFELAMADQPVKATVVTSGMSTPLTFGDNKKLAALAKTLEGKTVLIGGDLRRASDRHIAVQPTRFVYYVQVNTLKAAE